MSRRLRILTAITVLTLVTGWAAPASATLSLSFNFPTYSATVGGSVAVQVFVTQTPGGAQVGAGNGLLTGSIEVSFAASGPALITSTSQIVYGPAWDLGSSSNTLSGGNSLYDISLLSGFPTIDGVTDLTQPLLLATLNFTATAAGTQTIRVTQQDPNSPDFFTTNGEVVDPTNTAVATIVVSPSAVPEPGSFALVGLATLLLVPTARRRRSVVRRPV